MPSIEPPSVAKDPARELFEQRFRIVYATRTHRGMRVADIGASDGAFAVLFARAVGPEGRVYAVGGAESFAPAMQVLAQRYRVDNLVPMLGSPEGTGLDGGSVDLAFLHGPGGRFAPARPMLDSIYQALVPYGILILVAERPEPGLGPLGGVGGLAAQHDDLVAVVEAAGFRLVQDLRFLRGSYFMRFEKVGDEPDMEVGPIETQQPGGDRGGRSEPPSPRP